MNSKLLCCVEHVHTDVKTARTPLLLRQPHEKELPDLLTEGMKFPPTWMVFLEEEFETAQPRLEGVATMELLAQVWHTGRILGNFRVALGGEARLKVDVDLGAMVPVEVFTGWRFKTQYWLRHIRIRTNMTSSVWMDLAATLAAKDGSVFDDGGAEIPEMGGPQDAGRAPRGQA
jgi:hypothetical protein